MAERNPPEERSILARLGAARVSLREGRADDPEAATGVARYEVLGEIARGGVGVVLKGHDVDLGRDVAMKMIRDEHVGNPDVVQRFVDEAQIGGQLQHPGIVPVYEMGLDERARPFFTMKLIKGRTLADLLAERTSPSAERRRFLAVFEAICQTMAYAHARGVIHRDLKPANVMVGAFGEVLVVDWGMGKVLDRDESPARAPEQAGAPSVIATARSKAGDSHSLVGSVMGTPGYMPPEQARGDVEQLDERSDVFSLGAILCEILTGQPPYVGAANEQLLQAARGDLDDAVARLDACGADAEVVKLAKHCLVPAAAARPRDAGYLAEQIAAYLASLEERARTAELAAAEARVRAGEERRRRQLWLALAGAIVLLVVGGGGGWLWTAHARQERRAKAARLVGEALEEASRFEARAAETDDVVAWREAAAAARRAQAVAAGRDADPETRARADSALARIRQATLAAEERRRREARERALVARLVAIHDRVGDAYDFPGADDAYGDAFRAHDFELAALDDAAALAAIQGSGVRLPIVFALEDWAFARRLAGREGAERLERLARRADPDPWRSGLRDARDLAALRRLAHDADPGTLPVESAVRLGRALSNRGDPATAVAVLRAAQRRHPGDFWVNYWMAIALERDDEALRYFAAALALRPQSVEVRHRLGIALEARDEFDEALRVFTEATALRPEDGHMLSHVAGVLAEKRAFEKAEATARRALELSPNDANAWTVLGVTVLRRGRPVEALAAYERALELRPTATTYANVAGIYALAGDVPRGFAYWRKALAHDPDFYRKEGGDRFMGRAAAYARRLQPKYPDHPHLPQLVAQLETLAGMEGRLPGVLSGQTPPRTAAERAQYARLCRYLGRNADAVRLHTAAFAEAPALAADLANGHRHDAACAAALAAAEPAFDAAARARYRAQAIAWLEADLATCKTLGSAAVERLRARWRADPDLAGVRDALPE